MMKTLRLFQVKAWIEIANNGAATTSTGRGSVPSGFQRGLVVTPSRQNKRSAANWICPREIYLARIFHSISYLIADRPRLGDTDILL